jgi:pyroglutamyl-peptidase
VKSRILPVSLDGYRPALAEAIEVLEPSLVIALGLAQGEATVRVERVGINVADFEIADNDGVVARSRPLEPNGPDARFATLPVAGIVEALLAAGIPAHVSNTAGAYLCNACLYSLVGMRGPGRCGFIHLPYLPEQVADVIASDRRKGAGVPSMSLETMVRAVSIAIEVSLRSDDAMN